VVVSTSRCAARPRFDRLSAADASNLSLESRTQAYTIGVVAILDACALARTGAIVDIDRWRRALAPRVQALPRLRQRVRPSRWGEGLPVWVDCPVDLSQHIRAGPRVEGRDGLAALCGRLMAEPLPRDRPLWDLLVVPGVGPDLVAVVLRIHHVVADGVAAMALLAGLFDADPPVRTHDVTDAGAQSMGEEPRGEEPTTLALRVDTLRRALGTVVSAVRRIHRLPRSVRHAVRAGRHSAAVLRHARAPASLLGPLGSRRGVVLMAADLNVVQDSAHGLDGTVNDALLAAVSQGARAVLASRGEPVDVLLPMSVPVSLRTGGDSRSRISDARAGTGDGGNQVGLMIVTASLAEPDVRRRLALLARQTREQKQAARDAGGFALTRTRVGARVLDLLSRRQQSVALFVTNVPGLRLPLRLMGARVLQMWPLTVIAGNVRFGVAALSYGSRLNVTLVYDRDHVRDADVFCAAVTSAFDDLTRGSGAVARRRTAEATTPVAQQRGELRRRDDLEGHAEHAQGHRGPVEVVRRDPDPAARGVDVLDRAPTADPGADVGPGSMHQRLDDIGGRCVP
jgi:WS/DGAT/MGAT family acyltransferase